MSVFFSPINRFMGVSINDLQYFVSSIKQNSIAVQLQDSKLSMEAQIREELESEYMLKQQEIIASYGDRNISDLESKLREELTQVKGERERWKSEQEDLMKRVRDSQQQFECVREGFKSTSYSLLFFARRVITLGFPLLHSHFTMLLNSLRSLQRNLKKKRIAAENYRRRRKDRKL